MFLVFINFWKIVREYISMENHIRMKILREKYLRNMLNNQFLSAKKYRELKNRKELFYKAIIVSKDDIDKLGEQKMKKIRSIKQNLMGKKPKIIWDKLKDEIINDMWILFGTGKENEDRKKESKIKNIKVTMIKIEAYH